VVLFWPSKGEESTGGEGEEAGQEVEKEQDEKAKKEQRTPGGERGKRSRQEARKQ
jgi:hypothetical protein